ncbi:PstS family phosphate ABC transporter substrate-binding protein [Synechocystis sp. LKSZ1]|uniref:PstS family phosphate ABC transporter substrate-binding protein n=1 Tax=Synechocystis sp. LKSZ1 TaxID=3144951 RepID=UPI00336BAEED
MLTQSFESLRKVAGNTAVRKGALVTTAAFTTLSLGLGQFPVQSQGVPTIQIDGSSTVYPITEAVAEEFQKAEKGKTRVTVGISGTGGGFKKFCAGETDISNASRPISAKEREACKKAGIRYIELPVAFDALTVVVNPKNTWVKNLTPEQLKKMWEPDAKGKITNWNQIDPKFPNAPLKLYGPGADSGTFDYFTEAINGKAKASRTDFTPSEDDNVIVQGISRDKNALGYFGYAYYDANKSKVKAVPIVNNGKQVMPSMQTVMNNSYQPLSRPLFIYISDKSAKKPEVRKFVSFYLKNGARLSKSVKYVPLPTDAYTTALDHFNNNKFGSVFVGKDTVGVTINELLKLEGVD